MNLHHLQGLPWFWIWIALPSIRNYRCTALLYQCTDNCIGKNCTSLFTIMLTHMLMDFTILFNHTLVFVCSHGPLHLKEAYIAVAQRDIFIHHSEGEIRVEPMRFPDGCSGIQLTVRCQHKMFRPMGFLVSHIENLINEWYPGNWIDFQQQQIVQ